MVGELSGSILCCVDKPTDKTSTTFNQQDNVPLGQLPSLKHLTLSYWSRHDLKEMLKARGKDRVNRIFSESPQLTVMDVVAFASTQNRHLGYRWIRGVPSFKHIRTKSIDIRVPPGSSGVGSRPIELMGLFPWCLCESSVCSGVEG